MAHRDTQTLTETPTTPAAKDAAKAALDAIHQLEIQAKQVLSDEFQAIAEAAGRDESVGLRMKRHTTLEDLTGAAAWLARDLVDVLLKVAAGTEPNAVMSSELHARIRAAEVRLELLQEMAR